jgi:N-acetylglutamate synthase-like GNAT family acetyltransferase/predicted transcriptional regulator
MDFITELGALAFASRLKRLSERVSKDVTNIYKNLDINFEARWFPVFYALSKKSPMAITELAGHLKISHTAVKQTAQELQKNGYIFEKKGIEDERMRFVHLTSEGKKLIRKLKPIWKLIKDANDELLKEAAPGFFDSIKAIETSLERKSMYERAAEYIKGPLLPEIKILEYSPKLKKHFKSLNYEWLEEYFVIEDKDREILSAPKNKIINKGGAVIFAESDKQIVGTCAIIRHQNGVFELAKMAVTKKFRSRGTGRLLIDAAIKKAKELGAKEIYLLTAKSLKAANALYLKFGFKLTDENPFESYGYKRRTYAMKFIIPKKKKKL